MKLTDYINAAHFEAVLFTEAKSAFEKMITHYQADGIYMLGFYHSGCYSYLFPIALLQSQVKDDPSLRWCPCDADTHCDYDDATAQASSLLNKAYNALYYHDNDELDEQYKALVETSIGKTFNKLTQAGVFDAIGARDNVVLSVMCGDEGWGDIVNNAQRYNPESALTELRPLALAKIKEYDARIAMLDNDYL